jgi:hypothetical protein
VSRNTEVRYFSKAFSEAVARIDSCKPGAPFLSAAGYPLAGVESLGYPRYGRRERCAEGVRDGGTSKRGKGAPGQPRNVLRFSVIDHARDINQNNRLVADNPTVMSRGQKGDIARPEFGFGPVIHHNVETP